MNNNAPLMMAALFKDKLMLSQDVPKPQRKENEVLIKVTLAGICNTDHEITRGYVPGFDGIPGHEFIGIVEEADDAEWIGKKCTAEINFACGDCHYCHNHMDRHCPNRSVLGIINQNGAFAQYITAPKKNVILIPPAIPDLHAVFIEPLAAALEILDQVKIHPDSKVLLFGDGKLGLLIGHVMASTGCDLTVVGKHKEKLDLLDYENVERVLLDDFKDDQFDVAIEATGNATAFDRALVNVKPQGTLVLKSTYASGLHFNPALVVVNEINIVGSRCGLFSNAVKFLLNHHVHFEKMISSEFPLSDVINAFEASSAPDSLKVLLLI
jgi:2-desacetyl-2-hydroxyethyl bacteriochlorophyllide A dehydrogenase